MSNVEDIKSAVAQLLPRELARFRASFEACAAAIEHDALAVAALAAHRAGRSREL